MKNLSQHQLNFINAIKYYGKNYPSNTGGFLHLYNVNDLELVKRTLFDVLNKSDIIHNKIKVKDSKYYQCFEKEEIIIDEFYYDEKLVKKYFQEPINFTDKLYKAAIVKSENRLSILLVFHHLISDSFTMNIIASMIIDSLNNKQVLELGSYLEYLEKEEEYFQSKRFKIDQDFWNNEFKNANETFIKPMWISKELDEITFVEHIISKELSAKIDSFIYRNGGSPQVLFDLLVASELGLVNGSNKVTLGITSHNRRRVDRNILGMFVSTLPLVLEVNKEDKIIDFYKQIIVKRQRVYRHQMYPYEKILKEAYKNNINHVFDSMVIYHVPFEKKSGINYELEPLYNKHSVLGLLVNIIRHQQSNNYKSSFEFKNSVFISKLEQNNYIKRLLKRLNIVLNNENALVKELIIKEEEQIFIDNDIDLIDLITTIKNKHQIALIENDHKITYEELFHRAKRLASRLKNNGFDSDVILVQTSTKIDSIIALLSVLMSNNTYTFIPEGLSDSLKVRYMETAGIKLIIDDDYIKENTKYSYKKLKRTNKNLAIYFTSGSTGDPKAVLIEDKGVINYCLQTKAYQNDLINLDTLINFSSLNFDISLENIFLSLIHGKTLILGDLENLEHKSLLNRDFLSTTPSILQFIIKYNPKLLKSLKVIVSGGETLSISLVNELRKHTSSIIYNSYGPTEASIAASYKLIENEITIGTPFKGYYIDIVNKDLDMLPQGFIGELLISSNYITPGYLGDLNDNSIILKNNIRSYKTGDYGYLNEFGEIVLIGRIDSQIKKSGVRINLNQIDNILLKHPSVLQSKTVFSNNKVISHVATKNASNNLLFEYLKNELPISYLPNDIVITNEILFDDHGKTTYAKDSNKKREIYYPKSPLEQSFIKSLKRVFEIEEIYLDDTIYDYGADSMDMLALMIELNKEGIDFQVQRIYETPKIIDLIKLLDEPLRVSKKGIKHELINVSEKRDFKKILLLGSTGFLGSHILDSLLKKTNYNITVIVRNQDDLDGKTHFYNVMDHYFDYQLDGSRIKIIVSDVTKPKFGLDDQLYEFLINNTDTVVNAAAKVDYIGNYIDFEGINVTLIKNLILFSKVNKIPIFHISTIGLLLAEERRVDESDVLLKDNYSNYYLKTKREAEDLLIDYKTETNNDLFILRVGNLMPRNSDLKFQINEEKNAVYQIVKRLKGAEINHTYELDISPVDLIANTIIDILINRPSLVFYHLYNEIVVRLEANKEYKLYESYLNVSNKKTIETLKELKLKMKKINISYLKKVIKKWINL